MNPKATLCDIIEQVGILASVYNDFYHSCFQITSHYASLTHFQQ